MSKALKKSANTLIPGDIFHAGEFILDEIDARGMRQVDLAHALGLSKSEISLITHGKRNITVPIPIKLEKILGIAAEVWMNLQMKYEIETMKRKYAAGIKKRRVTKKKKSGLKRVIAAA